MARWYRRYKKYLRRRVYKRLFRRRRRRGFVNSSTKSTIRIRVPVSFTTDITVKPTTDERTGTVMTGRIMPFHGLDDSSHGTACESPLYRQYCNLYDEVKCIGAKVTVSIGTSIGTSTLPCLTVLTAWDRRCSKDGSTVAVTNKQLLNYGSVRKATAVNNSIGKLQRSCYASDLIEKCQWHDCGLDARYDPPVDSAFTNAGNNINFFSPGLIIGMIQTTTSDVVVKILVDIVWYFAFRGAKYGASASDSRGLPARMMDNPFGDDGDGGRPPRGESASQIVRDITGLSFGDSGRMMDAEDVPPEEDAGAATAAADSRSLSVSHTAPMSRSRRGVFRDGVYIPLAE